MKFALLLTATLAASASAHASCLSPTAAEKALCAPDVHTHCAEAIPQGVFAVLYCLKASRSQLSRSCADLLLRCGQ
jgi:hypothetical protein